MSNGTNGTNLDPKLFRYFRTFIALQKWHRAKEKFLSQASNDRYAVVGMALMDTAADLMERIGYLPIAEELRKRVGQLQQVAQQAILLNKRVSTKTKRAVGVNLSNETKAQEILNSPLTRPVMTQQEFQAMQALNPQGFQPTSQQFQPTQQPTQQPQRKRGRPRKVGVGQA
jgi:DNA-binding transcriptional regulator YbjK